MKEGTSWTRPSFFQGQRCCVYTCYICSQPGNHSQRQGMSDENQTLAGAGNQPPRTETQAKEPAQGIAQQVDEFGNVVVLPSAEAAIKSSSKKPILHGEIEILPEQPLPIYNNGSASAYEARALGAEAKQQISLIALVCDKSMPARGRLVNKFSGMINPCLPKLIGSGIVFWPPVNAYRYVLIYENTLGRPLMADLNHEGLGLKQDIVMNAVIRPMVNVFLDFRDSGFFHGRINPSNMFNGNAVQLERVMLGDCLAGPPGAAQPFIFEPIERAMTDPIARGQGVMADDLYAFGVTLTMLLRSKDPLKGMSEDEILHHKVEVGSYAALTGKERFTGGILELLRGLLYDDRRQRWTLDEVMLWLEGQRLSPKQNQQRKKASRPIHFNGTRYVRPQMLSMDLDKAQSEAAQLVDGGNLEQWLTRSLEDKIIFARYEQALDAYHDVRGAGYWDKMLSKISIALDPYAPIRYKGIHDHPEGLPYALAQAVSEKGAVAPYLEVINQQLIMFWLNAQVDVRVDIGSLATRYENCRAYLRQKHAGYGVERVLYYMLPDCPCYSDKLKDYYVLTPEDIMHAFEDMANKPERPELFLDRHIVAFLSVKDRRVIDGYLNDINAEEFYKRIIGNVKCLATIQKRAKMERFPGITSWIADIMGPVYARFHDRELRKQMQQKIEKLRSSGDIAKMAVLLDHNNALHQDMLNFKKAMDEYSDLREEQNELSEKLKNPEIFGKEEGKEYAAIVSLVLAAIVIVAMTFLFMTTGNTGAEG